MFAQYQVSNGEMNFEQSYATNERTLSTMNGRNWRIFWAKIALLGLSVTYMLAAVFAVLLQEASFTQLLPHVWMKNELGVESRFEWARYAFLSHAFGTTMAILCTCFAILASLVHLTVYAFCLHVLFTFIHFWIAIEGITLSVGLNVFFIVMHVLMSALSAWLWSLFLRSNQIQLQRMMAADSPRPSSHPKHVTRSNRSRSQFRNQSNHSHRKVIDDDRVHEIELPTFDIEENLHPAHLENMIRHK